jgi:hypothetical protein
MGMITHTCTYIYSGLYLLPRYFEMLLLVQKRSLRVMNLYPSSPPPA